MDREVPSPNRTLSDRLRHHIYRHGHNLLNCDGLLPCFALNYAGSMRVRNKNPYLAAVATVRALRAAGHQAYFAGGCVRDMVLGVEAKDFDVATNATPDVVMGMFPKTYSVGAHFGVVLVCTPD